MKQTTAVLVVLVLAVCSIAAFAAEQPNTPPPIVTVQGEQEPGPPGPGPGPGGPPPGPGRPGPGGPPMMFRQMHMCPVGAVTLPAQPMLQSLELTDEQREQLRDVMMKSDETQRPLREKAMKSSEGLRQALTAKDYDAAKVQELATAATKAEADLVNAGINAWAELRGILTEEQLNRLGEMMRRNPMGPRGPGGPPPMGPPPGGNPPPPPPPPGE